MPRHSRPQLSRSACVSVSWAPLTLRTAFTFTRARAGSAPLLCTGVCPMPARLRCVHSRLPLSVLGPEPASPFGPGGAARAAAAAGFAAARDSTWWCVPAAQIHLSRARLQSAWQAAWRRGAATCARVLRAASNASAPKTILAYDTLRPMLNLAALRTRWRGMARRGPDRRRRKPPRRLLRH